VAAVVVADNMKHICKVVEGTLEAHLVHQRMHKLETGQVGWVHQNSVVLHQGGSSVLRHLMDQCLVEG
jgi:hypothetical protein